MRVARRLGRVRAEAGRDAALRSGLPRAAEEGGHRRRGGAQLGRVGVSRHGAARRARLGDSDRDTRFASAFWTGLHAALCASLSPNHHNNASKVELVDGVIADALRYLAGERADDWPAAGRRRIPPAGAPPPIPPAGFTVEAAPPGDLGAALVGRTLLYCWPDNGWQRDTIARLCPRGAFSHVVADVDGDSALHGTADRLLEAAC